MLVKTQFTVKTMLKKLILAFSFGFICLGIMAARPLASRQQIGMFKNSKTCVVFENGISLYNGYIKDAVQKYWKSTGYEFIDQNEFDKRRSDSRYSFIVLMDEAYDKDPAGVKYSYINLVLGDASDILNRMPEFCSLPLSYSGDNETNYEYIIPEIIKFMQIHVKNLEKHRFPVWLNGLNYYNKRGFKDKVLLLNKEAIAPNADSPEIIKNVYPYYIKLLTTSEIEEEINNNPPNTLVQFHVGPPKDAGAGKCFEMIFDIEGKMYYYNSRKITNDNPDGFNVKDFNNIR